MFKLRERIANTHIRDYDASTLKFESDPHVPHGLYRRTSLDRVPMKRATFMLPAPTKYGETKADEDMYDWKASLHARSAFAGNMPCFDTWRQQLSWIANPLTKLTYGKDMEDYLKDEMKLDEFRGDRERRLMDLRDGVARQVQEVANRRYEVAKHCARRGRPYTEATVAGLNRDRRKSR